MNESIGSINSSLQLKAESISVSAKHMWFLLGLYCRQQMCYCSCSNKYRMLLSRSGRSIQSLCTQNLSYCTQRTVDVVLYCAQSKCTRNAKTSTSSKTVLFLLTVSYLYSIVYYYLYIILYIHHNIV